MIQTIAVSLEHKYRISGNYTLPDNFTLSVLKGAGFDVSATDLKSNQRRLGVSGMDIKSFYEAKNGRIGDLAPQYVGILVEKCLFHDTPNALVLSTLDANRRRPDSSKDLINATNIKDYAPHNIDINNCTIGHRSLFAPAMQGATE